MTLAETRDISANRETEGTNRLAVGVIIAAFSLLWLIAAVNSRGFGPADGCMHYLFARFAFRDPGNFVNEWGRPICTLIYSVPAAVAGRIGVCAASLLMGLGCGAVAYAIARGQGLRMPALALLFTLAQPLLFLHTLTAMTEIPFALLLGGAFLAYQNKRWVVAALLIALTPLARPEGFGFIALMALALIAARQWRPLLVLPAGLLLWDIAGWLLDHRNGHWWGWLASHWPWSAQSMYGRGNPLTFVAVLPVVVSPFILPATLIGLWQAVANPTRARGASHQLLCRRLTAAIPLFIVFVHSLLYATGKLASYGEARYLLVVAPFWGVCAARGWEWIFRRSSRASAMRWAAVAALLPIGVDLVDPVVPLKPDSNWLIAQRAARWYAGSGVRARFPRFGTSHPGLFEELDQSPTDEVRVLAWNRRELLKPRPGALLFWDPVFGDKNASPDRAVRVEDLINAGWIDDLAADAMLNGGDSPSKSDAGWHVLHAP